MLVAPVLFITDFSIFLLHLRAGSSSASVDESSSPGWLVEVAVASSSWSPSYGLLPPLLDQGLETPVGWPSFWQCGRDDGSQGASLDPSPFLQLHPHIQTEPAS